MNSIRTLFSYRLDRTVVEVYGSDGAAVLAGATSLGIPSEAVAFLSNCEEKVDSFRLNISVVPVKSIKMDSDPGPWNPKYI